LGSNLTLTKLHLSYIQCSVDGAAALASSLRSNATLRVLRLAHASLGGAEGLSLILGALGSNRGLTSLYICFKMIDISACTALGESLASGSRLEELNMACCDIGPKGAAAIAGRLFCATLSQVSPLRKWHLPFNDLGAEGAAVLVAALAGTSCGDVRDRG
jgi:Ran GTPase-activating protein (RanGAP) involved in mRNA processing and transport